MGPPGDGRRGQLCRDDTGWPASACGYIYLGEREDKPARDPVKTVASGPYGSGYMRASIAPSRAITSGSVIFVKRGTSTPFSDRRFVEHVERSQVEHPAVPVGIGGLI